MNGEMHEAVAEKLEQDDRVIEAYPDENPKGKLVVAEVRDKVDERSLQSDLHEYPCYVEVVIRD